MEGSAWIAAAPERIGEDHDLVVPRLIFLIGEAASEFRLHAEDGKNRGRHDGAAHLLGLSAAGEIEDGGLGDADALEAGDLLAPLRVDGDIDGQRGVGLEQLGRPLGEGDEAFGVGKIGGLQEDAVDEGKDGGIGADSHGQGEDDHEGEDPVAEQAAYGVADFVSHVRLLRASGGFGSQEFVPGDAQAAVVGGPVAVAQEVGRGIVGDAAGRIRRVANRRAVPGSGRRTCGTRFPGRARHPATEWGDRRGGRR